MMSADLTLSVVVPVYNERRTLPHILRLVMLALPGTPKQIIVVDDCSTDGSRDWLLSTFPRPEVPVVGIGRDQNGEPLFFHADEQSARTDRQELATNDEPAGETTVTVILHRGNRGKGGALRTGLGATTGDVVVIQDADLEYDPADWQQMFGLIARDIADVVYGSRFYGRPHRSLYFHHYAGNRLISLIFNILYDQTLTDIEVCYKMFRREVLDGVSLTCSDFGFEIEFSAIVVKARRWRIYEVGISYHGRTYEEGKKINWRDGLRALGYLVRFRF
jgi:glycosyltransferase involved in cell wall biosynthesis